MSKSQTQAAESGWPAIRGRHSQRNRTPRNDLGSSSSSSDDDDDSGSYSDYSSRSSSSGSSGGLSSAYSNTISSIEEDDHQHGQEDSAVKKKRRKRILRNQQQQQGRHKQTKQQQQQQLQGKSSMVNVKPGDETATPTDSSASSQADNDPSVHARRLPTEQMNSNPFATDDAWNMQGKSLAQVVVARMQGATSEQDLAAHDGDGGSDSESGSDAGSSSSSSSSTEAFAAGRRSARPATTPKTLTLAEALGVSVKVDPEVRARAAAHAPPKTLTLAEALGVSVDIDPAVTDRAAANAKANANGSGRSTSTTNTNRSAFVQPNRRPSNGAGKAISQATRRPPAAAAQAPASTTQTPAPSTKNTSAEKNMDVKYLAEALGVPTSFFGVNVPPEEPSTVSTPSQRPAKSVNTSSPRGGQGTDNNKPPQEAPKTLTLAEALGLPLEKPGQERPAAKTSRSMLPNASSNPQQRSASNALDATKSPLHPPKQTLARRGKIAAALGVTDQVNQILAKKKGSSADNVPSSQTNSRGDVSGNSANTSTNSRNKPSTKPSAPRVANAGRVSGIKQPSPSLQPRMLRQPQSSTGAVPSSQQGQKNRQGRSAPRTAKTTTAADEANMDIDLLATALGVPTSFFDVGQQPARSTSTGRGSRGPPRSQSVETANNVQQQQRTPANATTGRSASTPKQRHSSSAAGGTPRASEANSRPQGPVKTLSLAEALGMPLEKPVEKPVPRTAATNKRPSPAVSSPATGMAKTQSKTSAPAKRSLFQTVMKNVSESESEDDSSEADSSSGSEGDDDDDFVTHAPSFSAQAGSLAAALGMAVDPSSKATPVRQATPAKGAKPNTNATRQTTTSSSKSTQQSSTPTAVVGRSLMQGVMSKMGKSSEAADSASSARGKTSTASQPIAGSLAAALGLSVEPSNAAAPAPKAPSTTPNQAKSNAGKSLFSMVIKNVSESASEMDSDESDSEIDDDDEESAFTKSSAAEGIQPQPKSLASALGMFVDPSSKAAPVRQRTPSTSSSTRSTGKSNSAAQAQTAASPGKKTLFGAIVHNMQDGSRPAGADAKRDMTLSSTESVATPQAGSLADALNMKVDNSSKATPIKQARRSEDAEQPKSFLSSVMQKIAEVSEESGSDDSSSSEEDFFATAGVMPQAGSLAAALGMKVDTSSKAPAVRRLPSRTQESKASGQQTEPGNQIDTKTSLPDDDDDDDSSTDLKNDSLIKCMLPLDAVMGMRETTTKNPTASDPQGRPSSNSRSTAKVGSLVAALGAPVGREPVANNDSGARRSQQQQQQHKTKGNASSKTSAAKGNKEDLDLDYLADALGVPASFFAMDNQRQGQGNVSAGSKPSSVEKTPSSNANSSRGLPPQHKGTASPDLRRTSPSAGSHGSESRSKAIAQIPRQLMTDSPARTVATTFTGENESKESIIDSFYEHVAEVRTEMTDLISEISQTKHDMSGVRKEINVLEQRINSLETVSNEDPAAIMPSQAALSLKHALVESEAKTAGATAYSKALEDKLNSTSKVYADRLSELHQQLSDFEKQVSEKSDKIRKLESNIDSEQQVKHALSERWMETEAKLENVCEELQHSREVLKREYEDVRKLKQSLIDEQRSIAAQSDSSLCDSPVVIERRTSDILRNMESNLRREGERRKNIKARLKARQGASSSSPPSTQADTNMNDASTPVTARNLVASLSERGRRSLADVVVEKLSSSDTQRYEESSNSVRSSRTLSEALGLELPLEEPVVAERGSKVNGSGKSLSQAVVSKLAASGKEGEARAESSKQAQTKTLAEALGLPLHLPSENADSVTMSSRTKSSRSTAVAEGSTGKSLSSAVVQRLTDGGVDSDAPASHSSKTVQTRTLAEALGLPLEKPSDAAKKNTRKESGQNASSQGPSFSDTIVQRLADGSATAPQGQVARGSVMSQTKTLAEALGLPLENPASKPTPESRPRGAGKSLSDAVVGRVMTNEPSQLSADQAKNSGRTLALALGLESTSPTGNNEMSEARSPKSGKSLSAAVVQRMAHTNDASSDNASAARGTRTLAEALGMVPHDDDLSPSSASPSMGKSTKTTPASSLKANGNSLSAAVVRRLEAGAAAAPAKSEQANTLAEALGLSPKPDNTKSARNKTPVSPSKPRGKPFTSAVVQKLHHEGSAAIKRSGLTEGKTLADALGLSPAPDSSSHATPPQTKSLASAVVMKMASGQKSTHQQHESKTLADALGLPMQVPQPGTSVSESDGESQSSGSSSCSSSSSTLADCVIDNLHEQRSTFGVSGASATAASQSRTLADALGLSPPVKTQDVRQEIVSRPLSKMTLADAVANRLSSSTTSSRNVPHQPAVATKTLAEALGLPMGGMSFTEPQLNSPRAAAPGAKSSAPPKAKPTTLVEVLASQLEKKESTAKVTAKVTADGSPARTVKPQARQSPPGKEGARDSETEEARPTQPKSTAKKPNPVDPTDDASEDSPPPSGNAKPDPPQISKPRNFAEAVLSTCADDQKVPIDAAASPAPGHANTLAEALGLPKQKRNLMATVVNKLAALKSEGMEDDGSDSCDSSVSKLSNDDDDNDSSGSEYDSDSSFDDNIVIYSPPRDADGNPLTLAAALGVETEVVSEKQMLQIEVDLLKKQVKDVVGAVSDMKKVEEATTADEEDALRIQSRSLGLEESAPTTNTKRRYVIVAGLFVAALLVLLGSAALYMKSDISLRQVGSISSVGAVQGSSHASDSMLQPYSASQARQIGMRKRIAASVKRRNMVRKISVESEVQACALDLQESGEDQILAFQEIAEVHEGRPGDDDDEEEEEIVTRPTASMFADAAVAGDSTIQAEDVDIATMDEDTMTTEDDAIHDGTEAVGSAASSTVAVDDVVTETEESTRNATGIDDELLAIHEKEIIEPKFSFADSQHAANLLALNDGRKSFMNRITRELPEKVRYAKKNHRSIGRWIANGVQQRITRESMEKLATLVQDEIETGLWM